MPIYDQFHFLMPKILQKKLDKFLIAKNAFEKINRKKMCKNSIEKFAVAKIQLEIFPVSKTQSESKFAVEENQPVKFAN